MTERGEIYRCTHCKNIVEVTHASSGTLACCGDPMKLVKENKEEAATEKHIPVIEKIDGGYKVIVGSVAHPMQKEHYIEWIELICENRIQRMYLNPEEEPSATFKCACECAVSARAYCNLHGLWASK